MGRGLGASKRSGRNEATWDVTHLYMEAMLGIFLYSYPFSTSKNTLSFSLLLVFSSTKLEIRAEQVLPRSEGCAEERECEGGRRRNGPNSVCTCE
jgi:hypothetical protein